MQYKITQENKLTNVKITKVMNNIFHNI